MSLLMDLGSGKSATAHMIQSAAAAYKDQRFKYVFFQSSVYLWLNAIDILHEIIQASSESNSVSNKTLSHLETPSPQIFHEQEIYHHETNRCQTGSINAENSDTAGAIAEQFVGYRGASKQHNCSVRIFKTTTS